ncbi:MAG: hypothetical protein GOVbin4342_56 [Prokaryotic dsDNA virus sp.]|nr:MAG: hypothetical protein GOVbin4342_56 [Prokaryotic dsDNA virus sp.]|tara:strand:- start:3440 stop:4525 length:1086 start_codon:yes stop_codon:yes gene_type:complete
MPILHKNITASADIHNPKWFSDANNGDYAWRNEQGNLETIDELLLPAALNFVDASVAPPTSNANDIYVLSSGGSVHVDWGSVSVNDWVRYDGAAWNSITPQKSSLCYDENSDTLLSFDGTAWVGIGGDSIYTASGTAFLNAEITIDNTLTFKGGDFRIQGLGTSNGTTLGLYDNDTVPNLLWEWLDSGDLNINQATEVDLFQRNIRFKNVRHFEIVGLNNNPALKVLDHDGVTEFFKVHSGSPNYVENRGTSILGVRNSANRIEASKNNFSMFNTSSVLEHFINISNSGTTGQYLTFFRNGFTLTKKKFIVGASTLIGTEQISLQGTVLMNDNVNMANLPTSSAGLSSGDIWNDSGTLKIV